MKTASTVSKTDNVIQVYVHHPVLSDKAKEALPMCSMCHNMSQHVFHHVGQLNTLPLSATAVDARCLPRLMIMESLHAYRCKLAVT